MALPTLTILANLFTIHRLTADASIPHDVYDSPFFNITHTSEELSLILPEDVEIRSEHSDSGWACIQVNGPQSLDQVGILAGISSTLAEAQVSILTISTYDTDYFLVKLDHLVPAKEALEARGYKFLKQKKPIENN